MYFCLIFITDWNVTATRLRLNRLMSKMVKEANAIYSLSEFYGDGHKIHKGVKFQLSHSIIDESPCDFFPRLVILFKFIQIVFSDEAQIHC